MVRDHGISATKPIFPTYLLPSFKFHFPRHHSPLSSSSGGSPPSSADTTPDNSPPRQESRTKSVTTCRLSRTAPNTLRCSTCSVDLAFASQIISKGFTGRYGRAYLVAPPSPPAPSTLLNIRLGKSENRQLVTGWHVVADISCENCASKLGWKYVDAKEQTQKYKVGKFILETERVVTYRGWDDVELGDAEESFDDSHNDDSHNEVEFDSEDEDECEDVFAGTWDAETVAKRRRRRSTMSSQQKPSR